MHLTTAFITFAVTFWVALDLIFPFDKIVNTRFKRLVQAGMLVLIIQIIYGAFVAGLDAGWVHNHWPMMSEGKLIHESVYLERETLFANLTEGKSGVQFVHRSLAYVVVLFIVLIFFKGKKYIETNYQRKALNLLMYLVFFQFTLGVFTLLLQVPVWLGVAHQVGAFLLLSAMTFTLHRFSK